MIKYICKKENNKKGKSSMKAINSGSSFQIYDNSIKTFDRLHASTYTICFSKNRGFFLEQSESFLISEKIYGKHIEKVRKVFRTYEMKENRNLGVILSGDKGIGKSLFAKLLCINGIAKGLPVIIVDSYICGIASFINSIDQKCIILFDEFDKTFCGDSDSRETMNDPQTEMLTLFDGINTSEKLFVITCNNIQKLSTFLINRPGRFHYHFRFDYPTAEEITEYLQDNIDKQYWGEIENVVSFAGRVKLTYDCLRAIAFEINGGESFKSAIQDLNIINIEAQTYNVELQFSDGSTDCRRMSFDAFADHGIEQNFDYNGEYGVINVMFNPKNMQYNKETSEFYLSKEQFNFSWRFDVKDVQPERIVFSRVYRDTQYNYNM